MTGLVLPSVNGPPGPVAVATERHCRPLELSRVVYHITHVDPNLATLGAQVEPEAAHDGRVGSASWMGDHVVRLGEDITCTFVMSCCVEYAQ
jgi:hypothetical protein